MDLSGKLLIAMPGMGDSRFARSVVFLCAHSDEGAMGLIVNKPAPDLSFEQLLEQVKIRPRGQAAMRPTAGHPAEGRAIRVHFGGPMEHGRGFVLHTADYSAKSATLRVDSRFGMTATLDVLEDIAQGVGPAHALLALGYSGWGPGQLEQEILRNGWLTCDAAPDLVFAADNPTKWERALRTLGVDPLGLSAMAGRA